MTSPEVLWIEGDDDGPRNPLTGHPGDQWILDKPADVEALWGSDEAVAWAKGEALLIAGGDGSGKSLLAHNLIARLIGVTRDPLLGMSVPERQRVVYFAQDRPRQARRSLKRFFGEVDRDELAERLVVIDRTVPLIDTYPEMFRDAGVIHDADVVIVDSLKDIASKLSDEEVGSAIKRAYQMALEEDIEVVLLHHDRKASSADRKKRILGLDDIYGSRFIRAGCGSVLALNGGSGDPIVELRQVKTPVGVEVGPLQVSIDFETGGMSEVAGTDLLAVLKAHQRHGLTAGDAAKALFVTNKPNRTEVEKARRRLDKLAESGLATKAPGDPGKPVHYLPSMTALTDRRIA